MLENSDLTKTIQQFIEHRLEKPRQNAKNIATAVVITGGLLLGTVAVLGIWNYNLRHEVSKKGYDLGHSSGYKKGLQMGADSITSIYSRELGSARIEADAYKAEADSLSKLLSTRSPGPNELFFTIGEYDHFYFQNGYQSSILNSLSKRVTASKKDFTSLQFPVTNGPYNVKYIYLVASEKPVKIR